MDTIFIAREYLLANDYGAIRIDEEAVFASFNEAREYLKSIECPDAEDAKLRIFRTAILEYVKGETESYRRKWVYSLKGELIEQYPPSNITVKNFNNDRVVKFNVGDIVYLLPNIFSAQSPSVNGIFAVVVEVPTVGDEYVVYYIDEYGTIDHKHSPASAMIGTTIPLPNELVFLSILSKHMKKLIEIPPETFRQIVDGEVFVKNTKLFNCRSMRLLDPVTE